MTLSKFLRQSILHDLDLLFKSSFIVFQESFKFPILKEILFENTAVLVVYLAH